MVFPLPARAKGTMGTPNVPLGPLGTPSPPLGSRGGVPLKIPSGLDAENMQAFVEKRQIIGICISVLTTTRLDVDRLWKK